MEQNKITLPMDVSKGIQFDFTVEGITEEQSKALLDLIGDYIYKNTLVMGGGFFSVAHMEELERERKEKEDERIKELIALYRAGDNGDWMNDDIPLDELEEDEEDFYTCSHGEMYDNCEICGDDALLYRRF